MAYGRQPGEKNYVDCVPPLVVLVNGQRRVWDILLHTCDVRSVAEPCLACGYRDCPAGEPQHYQGCPSCASKL